MKTIILAGAIILTTAAVTFTHNNIDRKGRKEARIERREARQDLRRERKF